MPSLWPGRWPRPHFQNYSCELYALIALIKNAKDFWAGIIYIAMGTSAITISRDYEMGSALKMGPAYFPTLLASLLSFIGVISLISSFLRKGEPIPAFAWKPLLLITASTVVFGLIVRGAGLAIALPLFILMTSFASVKFRWGAVAAAGCRRHALLHARVRDRSGRAVAHHRPLVRRFLVSMRISSGASSWNS